MNVRSLSCMYYMVIKFHFQEAESILRHGAIPKDGDLYFSEDEEIQPSSSCDPFEE